ncbi:MAG: protein-disulfide reductase DsbD domain-containing protein, partial [Bdellovibrionia bacterium]
MKHLRYLTFLLLCLPLISLAQTYNFAQGKVTLAPYEKGLALDFELIKDWHIYWINSGDSGAPPIWYFEFQDNNTIAQEHWPLPKRIPANSLITFGYEERALFLFELGKKNIPFSGELKLEFLICKEECIPYINELSFSFSPEEQKESYINKLQSSFIYPSRSKESVIFYGNKGGEFQFELPSLPTNLELQHVFPFNGELFTTAPHQSLSTQKFA